MSGKKGILESLTLVGDLQRGMAELEKDWAEYDKDDDDSESSKGVDSNP